MNMMTRHPSVKVLLPKFPVFSDKQLPLLTIRGSCVYDFPELFSFFTWWKEVRELMVLWVECQPSKAETPGEEDK